MAHGTPGAPATRLHSTKVFVPVLQPDILERKRLLEALSSASGTRLLLVSAPAGSGKTTLVANWVGQLDRPAAWVSLDSGDDDPASFLGYVVEAFQSLGRGLCERTQALLGSSSPPEPRVVARSLVAELCAATGTGVLVLDDYHVITEPAIHDLLKWLVEQAPSSVTFVIISRSDPPLPLARLRATGQLLEVRESDLRFDLAEANDLIARLCRKELQPDSIAALAQRTEGWAVGLQLAGLALRQVRDPDAFVADFTGTHAFVADYLTDEVLAGIPEAHQQFLVRTAPLKRLNGPLCDAALERTDSHTLLHALHRANMFLVPLDNDRQWFRYHHLFADLLRRRGHDSAAAETGQRALLGRAAEWCEQNDALDDAIGYAMQSDDVRRAADLVARHGIAMLVAGQGVTVLRWIRLLPDETVRCSPDHCVIAAWALTLMQVYDSIDGFEDVEVERKGAVLTPTPYDPIGGYARRALEMLTSDRRAFPHVDDVEQHARVLLATADASAGPGAALRALEEARDDTPEDNRVLRAAAELRIGELCSLMGHYEHGLAAHHRAREIAVLVGSELLRLSAATGRAWILVLQGRLRELVATVEAELGGRRSLRESLGIYVGNLHALLAAAHLERNDLASTEWNLTRAWAAFGASGETADAWRGIVRFGRTRPRASHLTVNAVLWGFVTQIRLLIRRGEWDAVLRHLDDVDASMPMSPSPTDRVVMDSLRVLALAAAGERAQLRRWLRLEPAGPAGSTYWDGAAQLTRARAALAAGESATARAAVKALIAGSAGIDGDISCADAVVLDAVAAVDTGGRDEAIRLVEKALEVTAPEERAAPWLEAGMVVVSPLESVVREGRASARALTHAAALISMLRDGPGGASKSGPDALSERETTVLRLLAAGHTNQQIAATLFLAVGSVKKHTHNIFGKLGVRNRTQAAGAARERGLLR